VSLHVYDVGPKKMNDVLRPLGTGMFHCGVEVYFFEWAFCSSGDPVLGSGIFCTPPKQAENYDYRETVEMGRTAMSPSQVRSLLDFMQERWPADSYDTLRRNCCHFADELCRMLGVGDIPRWVTHMAGAGANLDSNARVLLGLLEKRGPAICCAQCQEGDDDYEDVEPIAIALPAIAPRDAKGQRMGGPYRSDMQEEHIANARVAAPQ